MVTPFWGADYNNGISATVSPLQPNATTIPIQPGWWDSATSTFWAPSAAPPAQGLVVSGHITGASELSVGQIGALAGAMGADNANIGALVTNLDLGLSAASQYDHDSLMTFLGARVQDARTATLDLFLGSPAGLAAVAGPPALPASSAAGSLWAWTQAGIFSNPIATGIFSNTNIAPGVLINRFYDPAVAERVGLSVVDEDIYGSVDFTFTQASATLSLRDSNFGYNPAGIVYDVTVQAGNLDSAKLAGGTGNNDEQTFTVLQGNHIDVDIAGMYFPQAFLTLVVKVTPEHYVNGVLVRDISQLIVQYTANFSVSYL
jgi:hypothetical protein